MRINKAIVKKVFYWIIVCAIGVALGCAYSYIIKQAFSKQTIFVFFFLYMYIVLFIKFLIRLFK